MKNIYIDYQKMRNYFNSYNGKKTETSDTLIFGSEEDARWELFYNKNDRSSQDYIYANCKEPYALYLNFLDEEIYVDKEEDYARIDSITPYDILNLLFDIKSKLMV